jgi:hypothetical protein
MVRVASFRADRQTGRTDDASRRYLFCEHAWEFECPTRVSVWFKEGQLSYNTKHLLAVPLLLRAAMDSWTRGLERVLFLSLFTRLRAQRNTSKHSVITIKCASLLAAQIEGLFSVIRAISILEQTDIINSFHNPKVSCVACLNPCWRGEWHMGDVALTLWRLNFLLNFSTPCI